MDDRFAAIADVHGSRWALEAVLEDIASRGIREIVNAGDHLAGPLDQEGTAKLLQGRDLPSVAGNQDRELFDGPHGGWLRTMPATLGLTEDILLFHGTPDRDDVYLLESVHADGEVSLATDREIAERLGPVKQRLLICGHTHIPRVVESRGRLIVNPGSVGLQAYSDDSPVRHLMETGNPSARYAILTHGRTGWNVELIAIPYDFEGAAKAAAENGRQDWAARLRTGRAPLG
ncbi:MAG TPA: metallophosphoesterase family protein [Bryobacteraceae bacterium]|nr:metallophosphoesterase family protein [Bryobacteraceae bacterium]